MTSVYKLSIAIVINSVEGEVSELISKAIMFYLLVYWIKTFEIYMSI